MDIFFSSFFSVTRDLIDHFGEEIIWLPFFHRLTFQVHNYHLLYEGIKHKKIFGQNLILEIAYFYDSIK